MAGKTETVAMETKVYLHLNENSAKINRQRTYGAMICTCKLPSYWLVKSESCTPSCPGNVCRRSRAWPPAAREARRKRSTGWRTACSPAWRGQCFAALAAGTPRSGCTGRPSAVDRAPCWQTCCWLPRDYIRHTHSSDSQQLRSVTK